MITYATFYYASKFVSGCYQPTLSLLVVHPIQSIEMLLQGARLVAISAISLLKEAFLWHLLLTKTESRSCHWVLLDELL